MFDGVYVIYKITFPNGKIYIGKDVAKHGHDINYFGSWNCKLVENDFTRDQLQDFTIRREILHESRDMTEINRLEGEYIVALKSNDPVVGYNQTHRKRKEV